MKKHFIFSKNYLAKGPGRTLCLLLALSGGMMAQAQNEVWNDVTASYIINADYGTGTSDGWTDGTGVPAVNATIKNAEYYQSNRTAAQNVTLEAGVYKLTVRGFHRPGNNDQNAINAHQNGTEVINAYLFAGEESKALVSLFSATPNLAVATPNELINGYPNTMTTMRQYCDLDPACYVNELVFAVGSDNTEVQIGIRVETNAAKSWTCWDDFKLYKQAPGYGYVQEQLTEIEAAKTQLEGYGATTAVAYLADVIGKYQNLTEQSSEEELNQAMIEMGLLISTLSKSVQSSESLTNIIAEGETLLANYTEMGYFVSQHTLTSLTTAIDAAKQALSGTALENLETVLSEQEQAVNAGISNLNYAIGHDYSLLKVKELADRIGGLEETAEYQAVETAMNGGVETEEDFKAVVQGLNQKCLEKMTQEFLSGVTEENPLDLTSFIVNPNICQGENRAQMPDGWTVERLDGKNWDGKDYTSAGDADTDLLCYSWSGNGGNNIGNGWYYQQIGGGDGALVLPRGYYVLKAATYSVGGDNAAYLYTSTDNTVDHIEKARLNTNRDTYETARTNQETTTATEMLEVKDGVLYFGMRGRCIDGEGYVGGNGRQWNADNFRLYFVRPLPTMDEFYQKVTELDTTGDELDAMGATQAAADLDKLVADYRTYTDDTPTETVDAAREDIENKMTLITTTLAELNAGLQEKLTDGQTLLTGCEEGRFTASEANRNVMQTTLDNAENAVKTAALADLENVLGEQTGIVDAAAVVLRTRISLNYSLVKAKSLADGITGLSETEAYRNVAADLTADELTYEQMKADVAALNEVCAEAMTPAFLAGATEEEPIEMTSFIVNPNIYQNNANTGTYLAPDGWNCDERGSADNHFPTSDAETDTDLLCYSWSGNANNSISKGWYYQQIGDADGKVNLPDGLYVLKAATYSTGGGNAAYLYASTDNSGVPMVKSNINTNHASYQNARTALETTTATDVVEVRGGVLYIGMKGRTFDEGGYAGGTGRQWNADNFRLYYVGALETTVDLTMKADWATLILPFDAALQDGMTVYSCASVADDGMLNLVEVTDGLKANTPYIIGAATGSKFSFSGISVAEGESAKSGLLTGVYEDAFAPEGSYVLQNQEADGVAFYHVAAGTRIAVGQNRAYLTLPETVGANVRALYFPGEATGVETVDAADVTVDVYTLGGICVRRHVKKADALKGLKGVYILKAVE